MFKGSPKIVVPRILGMLIISVLIYQSVKWLSEPTS